MSEQIELKPCPFCGGEADILVERDGEWYKKWYIVSCYSCGAKIEDSRAFLCDGEKISDQEANLIEKELIEKWNRRTNDE